MLGNSIKCQEAFLPVAVLWIYSHSELGITVPPSMIPKVLTKLSMMSDWVSNNETWPTLPLHIYLKKNYGIRHVLIKIHSPSYHILTHYYFISAN